MAIRQANITDDIIVGNTLRFRNQNVIEFEFDEQFDDFLEGASAPQGFVRGTDSNTINGFTKEGYIPKKVATEDITVELYDESNNRFFDRQYTIDYYIQTELTTNAGRLDVAVAPDLLRAEFEGEGEDAGFLIEDDPFPLTQEDVVVEPTGGNGGGGTGSVAPFTASYIASYFTGSTQLYAGYEFDNTVIWSASTGSNIEIEGRGVTNNGTHFLALEDSNVSPLQTTLQKWDVNHNILSVSTVFGDMGYPLDLDVLEERNRVMIGSFGWGPGSSDLADGDYSVSLFDLDGNIVSQAFQSDASYDVHILPDGRYIASIDFTGGRGDYVIIMNDDLEEIGSMNAQGTGESESPNASSTTVLKDGSAVILRIESKLKKFSLIDYSLIVTQSYNIGYGLEKVTCDSSSIYTIRNDSSESLDRREILVNDYNLSQSKVIDLNTSLPNFNTHTFTDVEDIAVLDEGILLVGAITYDGQEFDARLYELDVATESGSLLRYYQDGSPLRIASNYRGYNFPDLPAAPFNLATGSVTDSTVVLTWDYTSGVGISSFTSYVDGVQQDTGIPLASASAGYTFDGLTFSTEYSLGIQSVDTNGSGSYINATKVTTNSLPPSSNIDDFEGYSLGAVPTGFSTASGADAGWVVTNSQSLSGTQSFGSVNINDGQTASVEVTVQYTGSSYLSFDYYPSSESGFDFFKFYIDGIEEFQASGQPGWQNYASTISAGTYTYRFEYVKDGSVSNNDDAAYIDDLDFYDGVIQ